MDCNMCETSNDYQLWTVLQEMHIIVCSQMIAARFHLIDIDNDNVVIHLSRNSPSQDIKDR